MLVVVALITVGWHAINFEFYLLSCGRVDDGVYLNGMLMFTIMVIMILTMCLGIWLIFKIFHIDIIIIQITSILQVLVLLLEDRLLIIHKLHSSIHLEELLHPFHHAFVRPLSVELGSYSASSACLHIHEGREAAHAILPAQFMIIILVHLEEGYLLVAIDALHVINEVVPIVLEGVAIRTPLHEDVQEHVVMGILTFSLIGCIFCWKMDELVEVSEVFDWLSFGVLPPFRRQAWLCRGERAEPRQNDQYF